MALAKAFSIGLYGLSGTVIEIEADISAQLPAFVLVGLPDASLAEATSRVRAACSNIGHGLPSKKVVVNLSPASVPKSGAGFDLAIAVAVLAAMQVIQQASLSGAVFLGELGLDGSVRAVPGILPAVLAARNAGFERAYVPQANLSEARLVAGIDARGVAHLAKLVGHFRDGVGLDDGTVTTAILDTASGSSGGQLDLAQVLGQDFAVEGLVVAAAGGHHLSLIGAPGSGKTMLAERLPTILPRLSVEQSLEVAAVESISGDGQAAIGLNLNPRFVAPHHSSSKASLIGGGSGAPRPGAVSRAHHGVLFLDEALEFSGTTLDGLREPLESGRVQVNRTGGFAVFPARFQLALAANPCPCGMLGVIGKECRCSYPAIRRYVNRLSGPILDRIDIRLAIRPVSIATAAGLGASAIDSATAAQRVLQARSAAAERLAVHGVELNAHLPGPTLRKHFKPQPRVLRELDRMLAAGRASMRGYDRCLRLAWTLADLDGSVSPKIEHVQAAVALRGTDDLAVA
ncbi:MAG: YifB family Mg chelatase-like AAA ATPase [Micrococcales bacterium]